MRKQLLMSSAFAALLPAVAFAHHENTKDVYGGNFQAVPEVTANAVVPSAANSPIRVVPAAPRVANARTAPLPASVSSSNDLAQNQPTRYYYYPSYRYLPNSGQVIYTQQRPVNMQPVTQPVVQPAPAVQPAPVVRQPVVRQPAEVPPRILPSLAPLVPNDSFSNVIRAYLSLKGAYTQPHGFVIDSSGQNFGMKDNLALLGAVGTNVVYSDIARTRLELEAGYRRNEIDEFNGATSGSSRIGTEYAIYSGMLNIYQDVGFGRIRPYVGLGGGYAQIDFDAASGVDDTGSFAGQAMLGAEFAVSPGISITVEGRRIRVFDAEMETTSGTIKDDVDQDEISFGIKFGF